MGRGPTGELKPMSKTINQATRNAVKAALAAQAKAGETRNWTQAVACYAVGKAAEEYFTGETDPTAKGFATTYGGSGFLANCSQFGQTLNDLDKGDEIYVRRDSKASNLAKYE